MSAAVERGMCVDRSRLAALVTMQTTRCRLREFAAEEPQALRQHIRSAHLAAHRNGYLLELEVVADHGRCAQERQ
eukprot:4602871-Pyramimonas_sp.AAC.1